MFARVHCAHCDRAYETFSEDIKLMKHFNQDAFTFKNNTYYYKDEVCFFTAVKKLKSKDKEIRQ